MSSMTIQKYLKVQSLDLTFKGKERERGRSGEGGEGSVAVKFGRRDFWGLESLFGGKESFSRDL